MIKEMLNGNIEILDGAKDWKDAIKLASNPLIKAKKIEERYVDSMIENIKRFGEYIIMAPNIAMPHSRPENGVNESCLSLLKLNRGVEFESGEEVQLFLILGAKDNESHINILKELMNFFDDEEKIGKIAKASTVEEIKNLI